MPSPPIPALLELSIVLFVVAFMIFTWSLDFALAVSVTVVSAIFLLAVTMFTSLPSLSKVSPYKSPTSLACVIVLSRTARLALFFFDILPRSPGLDNIRSWLFNPHKFCSSIFNAFAVTYRSIKAFAVTFRSIKAFAVTFRSSVRKSYRSVSSDVPKQISLTLDDIRDAPSQSSTWKKREHEGILLQALPDAKGGMSRAQTVLEHELSAELSLNLHSTAYGFVDEQTMWEELHSGKDKSLPKGDGILDEVVHFDLLFKAFDWFLTATSSDAEHSRTVALCVRTLLQQNTRQYGAQHHLLQYTAFLKVLYLHGVKLLAVWYLASRLQRQLKTCDRRWLSLTDWRLLNGPREEHKTMTTYLLSDFHSRYSGKHVISFFREGDKDRSAPSTISNDVLSWQRKRLLSNFLSSQLGCMVDYILSFYNAVDMESNFATPDSETEAFSVENLWVIYRRRMGDLLYAIHICTPHWSDEENKGSILLDSFEDIKNLMEIWCRIYNHKQRATFDTHFRGLRESIYFIVDCVLDTRFTLDGDNTPSLLKWTRGEFYMLCVAIIC